MLKEKCLIIVWQKAIFPLIFTYFLFCWHQLTGWSVRWLRLQRCSRFGLNGDSAVWCPGNGQFLTDDPVRKSSLYYRQEQRFWLSKFTTSMTERRESIWVSPEATNITWAGRLETGAATWSMFMVVPGERRKSCSRGGVNGGLSSFTSGGKITSCRGYDAIRVSVENCKTKREWLLGKLICGELEIPKQWNKSNQWKWEWLNVWNDCTLFQVFILPNCRFWKFGQGIPSSQCLGQKEVSLFVVMGFFLLFFFFNLKPGDTPPPLFILPLAFLGTHRFFRFAVE